MEDSKYEIDKRLKILFEEGKTNLHQSCQFLYFLLRNTDTIPKSKHSKSKHSANDTADLNFTRCGMLLDISSDTSAFRLLFPVRAEVKIDDEQEKPKQLSDISYNSEQRLTKLLIKLKLRHSQAKKNPFLTESGTLQIPPKLHDNKAPNPSITDYLHLIENSGVYPPFHNHPEMLIPFITMHAVIVEMQKILLTLDEIFRLTNAGVNVFEDLNSHQQLNLLLNNLTNLCQVSKNCVDIIVSHTNKFRGNSIQEDYDIYNSKSWLRNFAQLFKHQNDLARSSTECTSLIETLTALLAITTPTQSEAMATEATCLFAKGARNQNLHIITFLKQLPNNLCDKIKLPEAVPTIDDNQAGENPKLDDNPTVSSRATPTRDTLKKADSGEDLILLQPIVTTIHRPNKNKTTSPGDASSLPSLAPQAEKACEEDKSLSSPFGFFSNSQATQNDGEKRLQLLRQSSVMISDDAINELRSELRDPLPTQDRSPDNLSISSPPKKSQPRPLENPQDKAIDLHRSTDNLSISPPPKKSQPIPLENPQDKVIDLHGVHVTNKDKIKHIYDDNNVIHSLQGCLMKKLTATTVILTKNNLTGIGAEQVCNIITIHKVIETLNMSDNPLLFSWVKPSESNKTSGWLGAKAFSNLLKTNFFLRELLIGNTGLTNDGLSLMAKGLADNFCLEIFDISSNSISDMGIIDTCDNLEKIPTLNQLIFTNNKLTDACGERLLKLLQKEDSKIIILDLRGNEFSPKMIGRINKQLTLNRERLERSQDPQRDLTSTIPSFN